MLVGISEAIRWILTSNLINYFLKLFNSYLSFQSVQTARENKRIQAQSHLFRPLFLNFTFNNTKLISKLNSPLSISSNNIRQFSTALASLYSSNNNLPTPINLNNSNPEIIFNQWLSGLIDGDGCFQLSKKGYASLEIVMDIRDKHCLYTIKQKFGGSVKVKSGINWLRYRLHHKEGLLNLISAINGNIRNPDRLLQLSKICDKYNIDLIHPEPLDYYNGWLSGFIDSDGSVYYNLSSSQLFISITQKNKLLLDPVKELYKGTIYIHNTKNLAFKWSISNKSDMQNILPYFSVCPLRSAKQARILMIPRYLELKGLKAHLAAENTVLGKLWANFEKKMERLRKLKLIKIWSKFLFFYLYLIIDIILILK